MFVKLLAAVALLFAAPAVAGDAAPASALVEQCAGKDGWSDPAPPVRIHGNVYYVGTCGIAVLLVTSPQGHVLIDGATADAAPAILRNIERLGFRPRDVKIILSGHEHLDHAGGFAALKRATGARLLARAPAKRALETGRASADDPQLGLNPVFPGAKVDGIVRDRQVVRLGPLALTAHATPGHTPGSTSWSWRSCDADRVCHAMVFADSVTALSNDAYRFSGHPAYVAAFRAGLTRIGGLGCGILITPHPGASRLFERLAGPGLVDPGACAAYALRGRERLDARLEQEKTK
jgi:metallo-beta-lactamase class B